MLSNVAGVGVESCGPSSGKRAAYTGPIKIAAGCPPSILDCPVLYADDLVMSSIDIHSHLTFCKDTGAVTHVAPALAARCAQMYAVAIGDELEGHDYFRGRAPTKIVGTAYTNMKRKLRRSVLLPNKAHTCAHFAHVGAKAVLAADVGFPIQLFSKAMCRVCMGKCYFRHIAPAATAAGAGYLQLTALKGRADGRMWSGVLSWLETVHEIDLIALAFELTLKDAAAVVRRPLSALACGKITSRKTPVLRLVAILALASTRPVKGIPPAIAELLWTMGVARWKETSVPRTSNAFISNTDTTYYFRKGGLVIEAAAYRVLAELMNGSRTLVVRLTSEPSVTCWADIGTSISGSLTASIAGNTPFALLVEAAFTMSAVTFADTYDLMPSQPGPGDLTILAREERFLADGLWDWAAGGRLTMAEIMSSLFSDA